jgi:phosphohistidine swiveling domain-containing protein
MSKFVRSFGELTPQQQPMAGGKGGALARLYQAGFPVPDGFVILPEAFEDDELTQETWEQVRQLLEEMRTLQPQISFAVRSSALGEDSLQASFAGEFESLLNRTTDEEIRQAIRSVYRSRFNERVKSYSAVKGIQAAHQVGVVVQQMAPAESSGVLFTANPVSGRRDQAVINAAWGLGETIVSGRVTPDTLTLDKETGSVLERHTADKSVMAVAQGIGTIEQPVPEERRKARVLSEDQAADLVRLGRQIEALIGMPLDIEWVHSGKEFFIVQARPITALPVPEPPAPSEWKHKGMAVRNNIVELMTEPLTPLFATFGLQSVNHGMRQLMAGFFGRPDLTPEEMIITVNSYAYYSGSFTPGQIVRILFSSVGIMRRMFSGAVERWVDTGRPQYIATVEQWQARKWRGYPAKEILDAARQLLESAIEAYGAMVGGLIPAAWISEGLFTAVYKMLIKRRDDPPAATFLLGFDSLPILAEKSLFDLAGWVKKQAGLAVFIIETPAAQLANLMENESTPASLDPAVWEDWRSHIQAHLQKFGHTIYNLDFANPVPADDPAPLLETIKLYVRGGGSNPYERQQAAVERRQQATQQVTSRLGGLRLKLFRRLIQSAQRYAPLREDALADVGLAYPLLRQMLRELGQRLVGGGMIAAPDDIFWLEQDEVQNGAVVLDQGGQLEDLSAVVPQRKATWRAAQRATPPRALPQIKPFGLDLAGMKRRRQGAEIKGVAASPGRVTAPACVLHGPEDFDRMNVGDVIVASLTTPAWTPLFTRAAAVVTDVGGPLSHGSIVAREFGIPAVLGTGDATERIQSGQRITVDGSTGIVSLQG